MPRSQGSAARLRTSFSLVWLLLLVGVLLPGCKGRLPWATQPTEMGLQTFEGSSFFRIDYPEDWVASDLPDGANLFYTGEVLFVRIKVISVPDPNQVETQFSDAIRQEAILHGGEPSIQRVDEKEGRAYRWYLITKPTGGRLEVVLLYHEQLQLLYVIYGSASEDQFDDFSGLFTRMVDSFQFHVDSIHPPEDPESFKLDLSTPRGAWAAYLEGLWRKDLDLLTRSLATINAPRLLNDQAVEDVRRRYFPYNARVLSQVGLNEKSDRVARAQITLRALPPEGYLRRLDREFIYEDGHWRVLRFE